MKTTIDWMIFILTIFLPIYMPIFHKVFLALIHGQGSTELQLNINNTVLDNNMREDQVL